MKTYFINHPTYRPDRLMLIKGRLKEIGLEAEHFRAIYGGQVDTRQINFGKQKRRLNLAEVGCYLSHRAIWTKILEEGHKEALILEDDAMFSNEIDGRDFHKEFKANYELLPSDWDMFYLGTNNYDNPKKEIYKELIGGSLYQASNCWLTHAYMVNAKCLPYLLKETEVFYSCIDNVLSDIQFGLNVYAVKPDLIKQDPKSKSSLR
jgi:glycosyl transferase family 25